MLAYRGAGVPQAERKDLRGKFDHKITCGKAAQVNRMLRKKVLVEGHFSKFTCAHAKHLILALM